MGRYVKRIASLLRESDRQIRHDRDIVRRKNLETLESVSIAYTILLIIYAVFAFFLFPSFFLRILYAVFIGIQLAFDVLLLHTGHRHPSHRLVHILCTLLCTMIVGFVILISVFPYPDRPAIFFSPVLVGVSVIFIFSLRQIVLSLTFYSVVFTVLAVLFKSGTAFTYDIWALIPAYVIALFCAFMITRLRINDTRSRLRWMQLSFIDRPTGLLNKATCEEQCRRFLCLESRVPCAMLVVDMDHFKEINDSEGHLFGDRVLNGIGLILQNLSNEDTIVGRIGGDEFLILMKHCRRQEAEVLAQHLISGVKQAHFSNAQTVVSCSIGITCTEGGTAFSSLFDQADKALYQVKRNGGNQYAVHQDI